MKNERIVESEVGEGTIKGKEMVGRKRWDGIEEIYKKAANITYTKGYLLH
jgi:hypothetical protein